jgi:ribosomal protein S18 acetylase RimI-like enzyme
VTDLRLVPMTADEYATYQDGSVDGFARSLAEAGDYTWEAAVEESQRQYDALLPQGLATPDSYLWTGWDGDTPVGLIWVQIKPRGQELRAFVYDVEVREEHRRKGYGRDLMLAAEQESRDRGATAIALNVFGYNTGARALYEELGYGITAITMRKQL